MRIINSILRETASQMKFDESRGVYGAVLEMAGPRDLGRFAQSFNAAPSIVAESVGWSELMLHQMPPPWSVYWSEPHFQFLQSPGGI